MAKKQKNVIEETVVAAEPAVAADPAPEPKKRGRKAKAEPAPNAAPPVTEPEATPKPSKKRRAASDATLRQCFEGYLVGLEDLGKSNGTCLSYRLELDLAASELGEDTCVADLTPERVLLFFACDRVVKTRSGRPKSPLSIAKTQRVLRQALTWAEATGMVAKVPLPEDAATH